MNSRSGTSKVTGWSTSICLAIGLWFLNSRIFAVSSVLHVTGLVLVLIAVIFLLAILIRKKPISMILPLAFGIGGAIAVLLAEHAFIYLFFPYPLDDGEGFCLNQAVLIASGKALYPPIDSLPYIVTNYPPVFPWLLSIFTNPASPSFTASRLISIISTILIAVSAAGCVRAVLGDSIDRKTAGAITALLVLSSPVMYFWAALARVDMLASALTMIGLWIAVSSRGPKLFWSLPFLAAAIFTRQSSIEAVACIVLALLIGRNPDAKANARERTSAIIFAVSWLAIVLVTFVLLNNATGGEFWNHTVVYTRTRFFITRVFSNMQWILPSHVLLLLCSLFALGPSLKDPGRRMLGIFFIFTIATALLSGKVGSDLNYFINLVIGASCLTGLLFHDLLKASVQSDCKRWIIPAMLLIPAILVQSGFMEGNRSLSFSPGREEYMNGRFITDTLSAVNGPILSEDEGFCLLAGHEVLFNPFIMSELAREGIWDQSPFIEAIENREFDIIMLRFYVDDPSHDDRAGAGAHAGWDRFTTEMEEAISANYELDPAVSPVYMRRYWFIYRPVGTIPSGMEFQIPPPSEQEEEISPTDNDLPDSRGDVPVPLPSGNPVDLLGNPE